MSCRFVGFFETTHHEYFTIELFRIGIGWMNVGGGLQPREKVIIDSYRYWRIINLNQICDNTDKDFVIHRS